tara:strand:+ start:186 stop:998 length:813 start_codon:yes stop_codon:yes gene_type:complete
MKQILSKTSISFKRLYSSRLPHSVSSKFPIISSYSNVSVFNNEVIKTVNLPREFFNEVNIINKLEHPNIIKYKKIYKDSGKIIFDKYELGDLLDNIRLFTTINKQMRFFKKILLAVGYCHNVKIIHTDLKLENVLIEYDVSTQSYEPILIDFGTSKDIDTIKSFDFTNNTVIKLDTHFIGTEGYCAPEIKEYKISTKSDIYSLGIILYIMLLKKKPILLDNNEIEWDFNENESKIHFNTVDLIKDMTDVEPENRPSIEEILEYDCIDEIY